MIELYDVGGYILADIGTSATVHCIAGFLIINAPRQSLDIASKHQLIQKNHPSVVFSCVQTRSLLSITYHILGLHMASGSLKI